VLPIFQLVLHVICDEKIILKNPRKNPKKNPRKCNLFIQIGALSESKFVKKFQFFSIFHLKDTHSNYFFTEAPKKTSGFRSTEQTVKIPVNFVISEVR
jgi:hypothetical protein